MLLARPDRNAQTLNPQRATCSFQGFGFRESRELGAIRVWDLGFRTCLTLSQPNQLCNADALDVADFGLPVYSQALGLVFGQKSSEKLRPPHGFALRASRNAEILAFRFDTSQLPELDRGFTRPGAAESEANPRLFWQLIVVKSSLVTTTYYCML